MKHLGHLGRGILVFLVFVAIFSLVPMASAGWDRSSVTLKPRENVIIKCDNATENFIIENLTTPKLLSSCVSVDRLDNENIRIAFVVPPSGLPLVPYGIYLLKIKELFVCLDLTETYPQDNIDNIITEFDVMKTRFDNHAVVLNSLQQRDAEITNILSGTLNIVSQMIDRQDNLTFHINNLQGATDNLKNRADTHDIQIAGVRSWVQSANENTWTQVNGILTKQDEKLATMQETIDENQMYAYAGIGTAVGLFFVILFMMRFKTKSASSPATPGQPVNPDTAKPEDPLETIKSM